MLWQPGELLYIPSGCPHALRHPSDAPSLAIGANFVDSRNAQRARLQATLSALGAGPPAEAAAAERFAQELGEVLAARGGGVARAPKPDEESCGGEA